MLLVKDLLRGHLVPVVISSQAGGHSKVVDEQRVLVDVLKDTELALVQAQLIPILEVVFWVQLVLDLVTPFDHSCALKSRLFKSEESLLNLGSME